MSVIKITVDEQNLHITDSPKIAAQGVNENYVEFTFSEDWIDFGKVALFYREKDEDKVYKSVIDETNKALVPHEVTDQDGKICIGVSGVKDDVIHTSEILKYKIVKGLYTAGESSEPPTPGIYEQMLTLAQHLQTLYEDLEADQQDFEASVNNTLANTPYLYYEENDDFELPVHTINDSETSNESTWSSSKLSNELNGVVPKRQLIVDYRAPYCDLRIEENIEINIGTVAVNTLGYKEKNIYIEGYIPISILNLDPLINDSNNGELSLNSFALYNIENASASIAVGFRNNTSSTLSNVKCRAHILYIRKEFFQ